MGVNSDAAHAISQTPPVGTLFAAFLDDNPITQLMGAVDPAQLKPGNGAAVTMLTGQTFFPHLIADAFHHGLVVAFSASVFLLFIAIAIMASAMRGKRYVHDDEVDQITPHHESIGQAIAREGAALEYPAIPEADLEYEKALANEASSRT